MPENEGATPLSLRDRAIRKIVSEDTIETHFMNYISKTVIIEIADDL